MIIMKVIIMKWKIMNNNEIMIMKYNENDMIILMKIMKMKWIKWNNNE